MEKKKGPRKKVRDVRATLLTLLFLSTKKENKKSLRFSTVQYFSVKPHVIALLVCFFTVTAAAAAAAFSSLSFVDVYAYESSYICVKNQNQRTSHPDLRPNDLDTAVS